mgnify:CR=1 FL=1
MRAGLEALATHRPDLVLVHDAARPLASPALFAAVIAWKYLPTRSASPEQQAAEELELAERGQATVEALAVVDNPVLDTDDAQEFLGQLSTNRKLLLVIGRTDEVGAKSVRNLPGVHVVAPDQLNTYDVLNADDVVFSVEALNAYIEANSKDKEEVSA